VGRGRDERRGEGKGRKERGGILAPTFKNMPMPLTTRQTKCLFRPQDEMLKQATA
jgi:hypothetical protein